MIALLASVVLASTGQHRGPAPRVTQTEVALHLDLTSFPNSTGPRRKIGALTPADYGFTRISRREGWTVLSEQDGGWIIGVRLLSTDASGALICFLDEARNGGTYRDQSALEVAPSSDGLFHAQRTLRPVRGCPSVP